MTTLLVIPFICLSSHMETQASTVQKKHIFGDQATPAWKENAGSQWQSNTMGRTASYTSFWELFLKAKLNNLLMLQHWKTSHAKQVLLPLTIILSLQSINPRRGEAGVGWVPACMLWCWNKDGQVLLQTGLFSSLILSK